LEYRPIDLWYCFKENNQPIINEVKALQKIKVLKTYGSYNLQ